MAYHFFTRWKTIENEFFSIRKELDEIEIFFKKRVIHYHHIWRELERNKIEFEEVKSLVELYGKVPRPYDGVLRKLEKVEASKIMMDDKEINNFYSMICELKDNFEEEENTARQLLGELSSNRVPEKRLFYRLQELLNKESTYLKVEDEEFNKIEDFFLGKKAPGAGTRTYVNVIECVRKGLLSLKDNHLAWEGRQIQGIIIKDNLVVIKGDHYTSEQNARWIQGDRNIAPSILDPFSYLVERGKLEGLGMNEIKKTLGAASAEAVVGLEVIVYPEQLYVSLKKDFPVKFAISHLKREQVVAVISKVRKIAA